MCVSTRTTVERAVEKERHGLMSEMQVLQETIEDAFAAENGFPRVTTHQIAHPQGHDHKLVEQFFPRARMKREGSKPVGSRAAANTASPKRRMRIVAQQDFDVEGLGKERRIIVQVPLVD